MAVTAPTTAPRSLGKYELLEKIADSGMSSVYRARHRETGEIVAVKASRRQSRVMRCCSNAFGRSSWPRAPCGTLTWCAPSTSAGRREAAYLVMEYVDGEGLWRRIERDGPLPEAEAVRIILQVVQALHAAHARGIIHRDVKPDNILLTADGQAKLADLGLAKDLEASSELTRTGKGLGTPNFMAPEQFNDAKHAEVLCDVYSAGATLYTALTGELPFQGHAIAGVLRKKFNNELVLPRQLVPGLSERVDWAVRRALRANPAERHASCLEFGNALTGEEKGAGPAAPPPQPPPAIRAAVRPSGRRKSGGLGCGIPAFGQRSATAAPPSTPARRGRRIPGTGPFRTSRSRASEWC